MSYECKYMPRQRMDNVIGLKVCNVDSLLNIMNARQVGLPYEYKYLSRQRINIVICLKNSFEKSMVTILKHYF